VNAVDIVCVHKFSQTDRNLLISRSWIIYEQYAYALRS